MKYYKKIVGNNVYLSPMNEEDAAQYAEWMADEETSQNLGNAALVLTAADEAEWIKKNRSANQFAIVRLEDNALLGNCGVNDFDQRSRRCTVGLFIGEPEARSRGYGAEALTLLVRYCFNTLNMLNVMLELNADNPRALACYKKVGFKEIGRRRQSYFKQGAQVDEIFMDILPGELKL